MLEIVPGESGSRLAPAAGGEADPGQQQEAEAGPHGEGGHWRWRPRSQHWAHWSHCHFCSVSCPHNHSNRSDAHFVVTVLPRIGTNSRSHMRTNFIFLDISARGCAVMPVDRHGWYRQVSRCLRSTRRRDSNCRSRVVAGVCSGAARPGAARRVRRCGSRDNTPAQESSEL